MKQTSWIALAVVFLVVLLAFQSNNNVPTGTATGDLSGSYPNPEVDGLQGNAVQDCTPTVRQVLQWDSVDARWECYSPNAVSTRAGAVNTAYQPSTTQSTLVCASASISTGGGGNGRIEAMTDSANPPTTVVGTLQVATASTDVTGQLCFMVQPSHYYRLLTTDVGGTPAYAVVGNIMEVNQ